MNIKKPQGIKKGKEKPAVCVCQENTLKDACSSEMKDQLLYFLPLGVVRGEGGPHLLCRQTRAERKAGGQWAASGGSLQCWPRKLGRAIAGTL